MPSEEIWPIKVALALVDTISVLLVFVLANELFGDRLLSLCSAAAAASYPFFVIQARDVQTETLFMFFIMTSIWLTLRAIRNRAAYPMSIAGLCAAAAALVRPVGLVLLLLLPATVALLQIGQRIKQIRQLTAFVIGAAICLGPWAIRNGLRYHEFILVNDAGGYNFWRGTSPEMAEIERLADHQAFLAASMHFETVTSPAMARQVDRLATTPSSRSREWYEYALGNFSKSPAAFTSRLARNALVYWRPWLNPQAYSRAVVVASASLMIPLYMFALIGWNRLRTRDRRLAWWCVASALLFWILQIPFQVVSRFRIPITDPFLIIFAAASLTTFLAHRIGCRTYQP